MKFVRQICICKWDSFFLKGMSHGAGCVVQGCEVFLSYIDSEPIPTRGIIVNYTNSCH